MKDRLENDLRAALKNGNSEAVETLRFLLAQIQSEEINNRGKGGSGVLSDDAVIAILKSEVKKRSEAMQMFLQGSRSDLASREEKSIDFIRQYLPAELGRDQIMAVVNKLYSPGTDDFNVLMKKVMTELRGQADGKIVSQVVREVMNG